MVMKGLKTAIRCLGQREKGKPVEVEEAVAGTERWKRSAGGWTIGVGARWWDGRGRGSGRGSGRGALESEASRDETRNVGRWRW